MQYEYFLYLLFILTGTALLKQKFQISLESGSVFLSILFAGTIFLIWDVWAVAQGHWSFNGEFIIGFFVFNQPIEEILFFTVVPFFYIVSWEILKKEYRVDKC